MIFFLLVYISYVCNDLSTCWLNLPLELVDTAVNSQNFSLFITNSHMKERLQRSSPELSTCFYYSFNDFVLNISYIMYIISNPSRSTHHAKSSLLLLILYFYPFTKSTCQKLNIIVFLCFQVSPSRHKSRVPWGGWQCGAGAGCGAWRQWEPWWG